MSTLKKPHFLRKNANSICSSRNSQEFTSKDTEEKIPKHSLSKCKSYDNLLSEEKRYMRMSVKYKPKPMCTNDDLLVKNTELRNRNRKGFLQKDKGKEKENNSDDPLFVKQTSFEKREQTVVEKMTDDKKRRYSEMKNFMSSIGKRVSKIQKVGKLFEKKAECINRRSCCCRCFCVGFIFFFAFLYLSMASIAKKNKNMVPLASHVLEEKCYVVDTNSNSIQDHLYLNRTIYNYVRSVRYHVTNQEVYGLTPYHVGVPLCFIVFQDRHGKMSTLYNPAVVGTSPDDTVRIKETDILCPDQEPEIVKRYKQITLIYDDISDDYLSGRDKTAKPKMRMRENFMGGDAYLIQHLVDTLERRNTCNTKKKKIQ